MISLAAIDQSTSAGGITLMQEAQRERVRRIHADYCGFQEDGMGGGFHLWNLLHDIPGHCTGSTVTERTLDAHIWPS